MDSLQYVPKILGPNAWFTFLKIQEGIIYEAILTPLTRGYSYMAGSIAVRKRGNPTMLGGDFELSIQT
jgi:hypothetical protein